MLLLRVFKINTVKSWIFCIKKTMFVYVLEKEAAGSVPAPALVILPQPEQTPPDKVKIIVNICYIISVNIA